MRQASSEDEAKKMKKSLAASVVVFVVVVVGEVRGHVVAKIVVMPAAGLSKVKQDIESEMTRKQGARRNENQLKTLVDGR